MILSRVTWFLLYNMKYKSKLLFSILLQITLPDSHPFNTKAQALSIIYTLLPPTVHIALGTKLQRHNTWWLQAECVFVHLTNIYWDPIMYLKKKTGLVLVLMEFMM